MYQGFFRSPIGSFNNYLDVHTILGKWVLLSGKYMSISSKAYFSQCNPISSAKVFITEGNMTYQAAGLTQQLCLHFREASFIVFYNWPTVRTMNTAVYFVFETFIGVVGNENFLLNYWNIREESFSSSWSFLYSNWILSWHRITMAKIVFRCHARHIRHDFGGWWRLQHYVLEQIKQTGSVDSRPSAIAIAFKAEEFA